MTFILGSLLGYCIRGKRRLLAVTLATIAIVSFIILPAIALSQLALSVRHERLSRPPQTQVPSVIGLDCQTADLMLHNSKLKMRILANRYDVQLRPGLIVSQTPQAGELVEYGRFVGVTISSEPPEWMKPSVEQP